MYVGRMKKAHQLPKKVDGVPRMVERGSALQARRMGWASARVERVAPASTGVEQASHPSLSFKGTARETSLSPLDRGSKANGLRPAYP